MPKSQLRYIQEWIHPDLMETEYKSENLPKDRTIEQVIRKLPLRRTADKKSPDFFVVRQCGF
jgi:hypothetical protein